MKIYTKGGDRGETSLANGKRVSKEDTRILAIGEIDEVNSILGVVRVYGMHIQEIDEIVIWLQGKLFEAGAEIGMANAAQMKKRILNADIEKMEKWIDKMTSKLSPLKNFILPGGNVLACYLHHARAVSRRAERVVVALGKDQTREEVLMFLNRMSDLLFTMARYANLVAGKEEVLWK